MDQHTGQTPPGAPGDGAPDVGMFEQDASGTLRPIVRSGSAGGRGRAFGVSVPGAIAAALLVGALAFGAGGFSPVNDDTSDATPTAETALDEDATGSPEAEETEATQPEEETSSEATASDDPSAEPSAEPTLEPSAEPSAEPTLNPKETAEPTKEPDPTKAPPTASPYERLDLAAKGTIDGVALDWSACDPAGFAYYKVVRSPDGKVTWPMGDNDTLVAAIDSMKTTAFVDTRAPVGKQLYYRVFGVVEQHGKLVVACLSSLEDAFIPAPEGTKPPVGETGTMSLALGIKDGKPFLDWSTCTNEAFDYYKIVWSKDNTVTWPAGEDDHFAAAIANPDESAFWDKEAPGGKTLYYRVFCVQATDNGYTVLAATPVKSVTTPAPEPPPAAVDLGFSLDMTGEGVVLDWQPWTGDAFVYYKVVRSQHGDPSYLPWTDGTELIGVIEDPGNSAFQDGSVASGQTWYYRVQAIGWWEGQKVVLGETAVLEVTIP